MDNEHLVQSRKMITKRGIMMRIEELKNNMADEFKLYCKSFRMELDDSYLEDEELENFELNEENPTYTLLDEEDKIIGAASLVIDDYFKRGRKGRIRILHTVETKFEAYRLMFETILKKAKDIDKIFYFVPEKNAALQEILQKLSFKVERHSYLLEREALVVTEPIFPEGYELRPLVFGRDEHLWCEVRNESFAKLSGHETPVTPEMISKMQYSDAHLEDGMMILYHNSRPVGIIRAAKELHKNEPHTYIGLIAVKPEYQGTGLGRSLLRAGLKFGAEKGLPKALLTVNGENDKAISLYLGEGFRKELKLSCFNYDLVAK